MAKTAKTFGINKSSKRRQKRKKRESNIVPFSIIPRSEAPGLFQFTENNQKQSELVLSNDLKQFIL